MSGTKEWTALFIVIFCMLSFLGCKGERSVMEKKKVDSIQAVTVDEWKKLSEKKIYFGHQSVGFNIIAGMKDLIQENKHLKLLITETADASKIAGPIFAHARIGENGGHLSKFSDFEKQLDGGLGAKVDYAFLKLCYVDITYRSDAAAIFQDYRALIARLKAKYPKVTFIHVTTPLMVQDEGVLTTLKDFIKKFMNKPASNLSNIKRHAFNELLRKEYAGQDPVFDLAEIESIAENGQKIDFGSGGTRFPALNPAFSDDGGHLNKKGRKIVAEQLLVFLASGADKGAR